MKLTIAALAVLPLAAIAAPQPNSVLVPRADEAAVEIPGGIVIGTVTGVESFYGIPFADPPVGYLRLRPPRKLSRPLGVFNAKEFPAACPQMPLNTTEVRLPKLLGKDLTPPLWPDTKVVGQEDCLTVTVQRPKGTRPGSGLPVLFYIFGGGFQAGSTNVTNAEKLIQFAEAQNQSFVYVAVNYRVGGFGFLGGAEVLREGSTNLGLRDQRMGLEWVADNIAYFGGDPERVTIWGQSAGSISVFDQMALNKGDAEYKGEKLFRGAIMNSGSVIPTDAVDSKRAQAIFDTVAAAANCTINTNNTLDCLRSLSYEDYYRAANSVPRILDNSSLALSYLPRPDGTLLVDSPDVLASTGHYHAVPAIITSQEDEGTLFAFAQTHVTSTERLVDYLSETFFGEGATREEVAGLVATYPEESAAGSPFRTGLLNEWYQATYGTGKGFKRVAAILGDFVFTLARRLALDGMSSSHANVPLWSSLSSVLYGLAPYYGTPHGTDVNLVFEGTGGVAAESTRTYYLNFLHSLDPNEPDSQYREWPRWTPEGRQLLWTTLTGNFLIDDTFRNDSYAFLKENTKALYF